MKVHRTECPNQHSPNLNWYMLEAFAAGTNTSSGIFIEPVHSRRLETYSCCGDSVSNKVFTAFCIIMTCKLIQAIVFDTCEPHPLDLPRQYKWIIPRDNITSNDLVCFRYKILIVYPI